MTTRFQKLHITSRLISAYLLQCSQIPIDTLFCRFNSLFANTEMYEAINKLRNYSIIYANFIHEYGVNFHELYMIVRSRKMTLTLMKFKGLDIEIDQLQQ